MPYVEGETLRARLERERQLPVDETVRLVTLLGNALAYAHAHGVIHRDLKPENILLQSGQPVIADFGIALAVAQAGGPRVTETGLSLGTPHYMSPEQAAAEREIDARSDQYALAAVTYEMLSGEPPHTGPTAQAVIARLMTEQVRSLRATRPGVPVEVDRAVARALAKSPADRFGSVADFVAALTAPADPAPGRSRRRASRWLLLPAAALAIALAVFGLSRLRGAGHAEAAAPSDNLRVVAVLPFRNLSHDTAQRYFSAGMTEEIATELSRVAALRVLSRAATAQYDTAGDRLKRMSRELGVGSVVDGSVRLAGDRVRIAVELTNVRTGQSLWSEQYDRQLSDLFAVQDDVAHKVTAALQARLTPAEAKRVAHAPTSNMAAYQLYLRALDLNPLLRTENLSGGELLGQAIRLDSGFAAAYAQLARNQMFRSVAGERAYTDSAFIAARKAVALDPELADGWFALADLESVVLKLSDARRSYLKALELNPSHGGAMADLANVYVALGRYDEALDWSLRNQQLNPNQTHAPYHVALGLMPLDDDSATGALPARRGAAVSDRAQDSGTARLAGPEARVQPGGPRAGPSHGAERARRYRGAADPGRAGGGGGRHRRRAAHRAAGPAGSRGGRTDVSRVAPVALCPDPAASGGHPARRRAVAGLGRGGAPTASMPARRATRPRWSWPRSAPSRATPMRRSSGSSAATGPDGRTPGSSISTPSSRRCGGSRAIRPWSPP